MMESRKSAANARKRDLQSNVCQRADTPDLSASLILKKLDFWPDSARIRQLDEKGMSLATYAAAVARR